MEGRAFRYDRVCYVVSDSNIDLKTEISYSDRITQKAKKISSAIKSRAMVIQSD